jgi:hypothetical protein
VETNSNPIKIFKNQLGNSTKLGKNLYYGTLDDTLDMACEKCNIKYALIDQKYAPCQKVEILALCDKGNPGKKSLINLKTSI